MDETEFETQLRGALEVASDEDEFPVARVLPYEEAGVMTYNRGVVVRLVDGSEYQLSIVRSRPPD